MSRIVDAPLLPGPETVVTNGSHPRESAVTAAARPVERSTVTGATPDVFMPDLCAEPKWYRLTWLGAALVIVVLYAGLVLRFWAAADSGVDQNAYLVGGRMLAETHSMKYVLPNPYAFVGGMFVRMTPATDIGGTYFPKYPFGLPLLYAGFFWAFNLASSIPALHGKIDPAQAAYWAFLVSPVSAIAAVAGMFFLARQVSGSFAAALAAILLGTSQLMMMLADNPNSHAACTACIVWGMFFLIRWMQTGSHWRGVVGGLLVGYAATIRWNEITLFVAMCVVVLSRLPWNQWKTYRSVGCAVALAVCGYLISSQVQAARAFTAGTVAVAWTTPHKVINICAAFVMLGLGVLAAVFSVLKNNRSDWWMYVRAIVPGLAWSVPVGTLLLINLHTMGSPTGYDSTHESEFGAAFQWKFFFNNWEKVVRVFYDLGLFFVVPFAVAGVFMVFRRSWRVGALLLAWVIPGVMLYMSYYWSPDRADAYARFFLTYLPALLVGVAVCFHDGILAGRKAIDNFDRPVSKLAAGVLGLWLAPGILFYVVHYWLPGHVNLLAQMLLIYLPALVAIGMIGFNDLSTVFGKNRTVVAGESNRFALTVAAGMVVAVASGVSIYRTVHGLRDGSETTKIPLDDFRERLALAQTGQMLLANAPAKSVLFADTSGMIAMPANFMQFLRDWEMYPVDAFSLEASRRGIGGGARRNNNRRGGGGGFGGPGGGPPGGGPGGGGPGGGPGGGGGFGGNGGNAAANDPNAVTATPVQPEQQEYHASLYKNLGPRKLIDLETAVIQKAFSEGRRVFVVVGTEHNDPNASGSRSDFWGRNTTDTLATFKEGLGQSSAHFTYKTVARWQDVALPAEEETEPNSDPFANMNGGGGGGRNNVMNRLFMAANRVLDWKLVEIRPS